MPDRERLEEMARQGVLKRQQTTAARRRDDLAALELHGAEQARTAELLVWCEETFSGYSLPETGHILCVSKSPWSHACNMHVYFGDTRLLPGVVYVGLSITHTGEEPLRFQPAILLVLARAVSSQYEIVTEESVLPLPSLEAVKEHLMNFVADLGAQQLRKVLDWILKGQASDAFFRANESTIR